MCNDWETESVGVTVAKFLLAIYYQTDNIINGAPKMIQTLTIKCTMTWNIYYSLLQVLPIQYNGLHLIKITYVFMYYVVVYLSFLILGYE